MPSQTASRISVQRTTAPKPRPPEAELGFGRHFTDHMLLVDYSLERGWYGARVVPYGPLALDPAAAVLHYAQAAFEGMKIHRTQDGRLRAFRLDAHCRRMANSARRLCMPPVDPELMAEGIMALVRTDAPWAPTGAGTSLYVRPTLVATEPFLGVRPAEQYLFFVILSPVGSYYAEGQEPVRIWVEDQYVRAAPGGLGAIKAAANYAASLAASVEAKKRGYAQVLWLDARERRYIEEVGTMNLFVRIGDEVLTPPLEDGTLLAGITRDSILTLLREWGVRANERRISVDELREAQAKGTLREVFGTGTAAVISPVGELGLRDGNLKIADGRIGELSRRLYDTITAIQRGAAPDPHGWMTVIV
jgi:branched-chain amino acid aminotransferase